MPSAGAPACPATTPSKPTQPSGKKALLALSLPASRPGLGVAAPGGRGLR